VLDVTLLTWTERMILNVVVGERDAIWEVERMERSLLQDILADIRAHHRTAAGSYCRAPFLLDCWMEGQKVAFVVSTVIVPS
jgi:hypothetical protein